MKSMTAFARVDEQAEWGVLTWELRSVNHRYLETFVRLPEDLRGIEQTVRERVTKALGRGKVECNLRVQLNDAVGDSVQINEPLAQSIMNAADKVGMMMGGSATNTPLDIMRWPGVVQTQARDMSEINAQALSALNAALAQLVETRVAEGGRIHNMIAPKLDEIDALVEKVRARRPQMMEALKTKLTNRVQELVDAPDTDRIEQELVLLAQKLDVDEELDRLNAHTQEVRDVFKRKEPIGRRLDFLMQELNREANTLGSKSNDSETTQHAVDLKVLIEQMREQVQNVE